MVIVSCNTTQSSSNSSVSSSSLSETSSSIIESSIESTSTSSTSSLSNSSSSAISSSSSSSSISSSAPKEVAVGEIYTTNVWDEQINKMSQQVVGDLWEKIPVFLATNYEAVMNYSQDGNETFLVLGIKCFGVNTTSATRLYSDKMVELGYTINSLDGYGYLMKDYYSDLFLSFGVIEDEINYFNLQAVVRQTREKNWDYLSINTYADMEIPAYPAKSYQTVYDNSRQQINVYALFTGENAAREYSKILEDADYTLSSSSAMDILVYEDPTGYVTIQLYQTYGDYNCNALYICINNRWPTMAIASYIGVTLFPKLESDTARYDDYLYIDVGGEEKPEDIAICIYYVNVSNVDFSSYVNLLIDYGFATGESHTSDTGTILIPMSKKIGEYTASVDLSLQTSTNTMCIAIYPKY